MNVALRTRMTKEEFLAWEEHQELRHEFDGFGITAIVGATQAHELIVANIVFSLTLRLRGGPCRVFGSGMKIEAAESIRYPDATVACGPIQPKEVLLADPRIVFEVESRSTALLDQTVKNPEYRGHAIHHALCHAVAGQHFGRRVCAVGRSMGGSLLTGPDKVLAMPEAGIEVTIGRVLRGRGVAEIKDRPAQPIPAPIGHHRTARACFSAGMLGQVETMA